MKSNDKKQLFGKSTSELQAELRKAKDAYAELVLDKSQGKLKNTSSLANKRAEIAIIATYLRNTEIAVVEEK